MALEIADGKPIIAFGSLYLAGAVRTEFHKEYEAWMRREGKTARKSLPLDQWVEKSNATTTTSAFSGAFMQSLRTRSEFLKLIGK